ncbi:hypothetical protein SGLAM104S_08478 [Streptomyces glaucescens]
MLQYEIIDEPLFFIPDEPAPGGTAGSEGDASKADDPYYVVNACYDYLLNLRWTQVYEDLMSRITDEVFYVMFLNRRALANSNQFLSGYVEEVTSDGFNADEASLADLFMRDGELKRVRPRCGHVGPSFTAIAADVHLAEQTCRGSINGAPRSPSK